MIVVEIKLISAKTGKTELLGQTIINNVDTSENGKRGWYRVRVGKKRDAGDLKKVWTSPLRTGNVDNYPRLSFNVWRLVIRALLAAFPEEKK